jgi:hypothetical protein
MRTTGILAISALALVACDSRTAPRSLGALDSRITKGQHQSTSAGGAAPDVVIDQVFRNPITGRITTRPALWERVLLPPLAHALQSVGVVVQPNSVVCVREDQTTLVPKVRCVNSDSEGNTRFDFVETTVAGEHRALIQATYGVETTVPDTVTIVVAPDTFATSPLDHGTSWPSRSTPAEFPSDVARDKYGNAVPYRLAVAADGYAQLTDTLGRRFVRAGIQIYARTLTDSIGGPGARTVVIESVTGPDTIEGATVNKVRAVVQVVTAQGVRATGVLVTTKSADASGIRSVGLHATLCPINASTCTY